MKKIIIITFLTVLFSTSYTIIEITDKATSAEQWNFEIYNKTNSPITVSANIYGMLGQIFGMPIRVESFGKIRTNLSNISKPLVLKIMKTEQETQTFWLVPLCSTMSRCKKTMFLTVDNNGLHSQVGMTSDSGLSLENNINDENIFNNFETFSQFYQKTY